MLTAARTSNLTWRICAGHVAWTRTMGNECAQFWWEYPKGRRDLRGPVTTKEEVEGAAGTNYLGLTIQKGARGAEYVAYVLVYLGSIRWNYVAIWRVHGACARGHLAYEVVCFVSLLFSLSVHPWWGGGGGPEKCFHRGSNPLSTVSDRIIHWCKDNIKTKLGQTLWICEMYQPDQVTDQSPTTYSEHNYELRTS